jgi:hypothetical protein
MKYERSIVERRHWDRLFLLSLPAIVVAGAIGCYFQGAIDLFIEQLWLLPLWAAIRFCTPVSGISARSTAGTGVSQLLVVCFAVLSLFISWALARAFLIASSMSGPLVVVDCLFFATLVLFLVCGSVWVLKCRHNWRMLKSHTSLTTDV